MLTRNGLRGACAGGIAAWLGLGAAIAAAQQSAVMPRPYRIECGTETALASAGAACRVDVATYIGWRVFHAQCSSCHAADALGSSFAPDLTARMRGMEEREFFAALDGGYLGPTDAMPPRGANPDVARYYAELWSYLSARVNGDLPPGPVERLPNTDLAAPD